VKIEIRKILGGLRRSLKRSSTPSHKYALNNIDDRLEKYLNFRNGFFVEAGAYDGVDQSNTYYLEKVKGWNGILIEPILENFYKIPKNRNCSSFNCALVSKNFKAAQIEINYAGLMSIAEGSMTDEMRLNHISSGLKCHGYDQSYKVSVNAFTLSDVLKRFNAPQIDFFSLDVEGYENEVLMGIDFRIHRPRYILVEERNHTITKNILESVGYFLIDQFSENDYLYKTP
jgi:FkbM family methyltransferase